MHLSEYLNELYGRLDNLDEHVKKLPTGVKGLIGIGVGLLVTRVPGDDGFNLLLFKVGGGEYDQPGKAIQFALKPLHHSLIYVTQSAIDWTYLMKDRLTQLPNVFQNISLNIQNSLPVIEKINSIPNVFQNAYQHIPVMMDKVNYLPLYLQNFQHYQELMNRLFQL